MRKPKKYSRALAAEIARRMIEDGKSLRTIAKDDAMPAVITMIRWCQGHPEFDRLLAHARLAKADLAVDEAIEIADEPAQTLVEVARNRVRVQTRLDAAAKLWPAKYSAKLQVQTPPPPPRDEKFVDQVDIARRIAFILTQHTPKDASEQNGPMQTQTLTLSRR